MQVDSETAFAEEEGLYEPDSLRNPEDVFGADGGSGGEVEDLFGGEADPPLFGDASDDELGPSWVVDDASEAEVDDAEGDEEPESESGGGRFTIPKIELPQASGVNRNFVLAIGAGVGLFVVFALFSMVETPQQRQAAQVGSEDVQPSQTTEPAFLSPAPEAEVIDSVEPSGITAPRGSELAGMVPTPVDSEGRPYQEVGAGDIEDLPLAPSAVPPGAASGAAGAGGSAQVDPRLQSYAAAMRSTPVVESQAAQQLRAARMRSLTGTDQAGQPAPETDAEVVDPSIAVLDKVMQQALLQMEQQTAQAGSPGGAMVGAPTGGEVRGPGMPSRDPADGPLRLTPQGPVPVGLPQSSGRQP